MARVLAIFFACTTAVLAAALVRLIAPQLQRVSQQERYDQDIVFPIKVFVGTKGYVAAKGTLSADWIAYKNNTYSFYCDPEECIVASVEQTGPKLVSSIDGPMTYTVKHWTTDDDVIAENDDRCSRITITLDRKTESVLWVETPIDQTTLACKNADDSVRKATLEASLYWRRQSLK
ncbi:hypothetical protein [Bradyrhizobium sp. SZCCHNR1075]|uniref:hypothetical protein n=1 Tax=Bradyrhizobium sp. SZCCHNR1075 TaxID=3057362 RepID=UPI0028E5202D|nr:hypothetical protein [Bradyrhizobium sp. SZCCHNR1075]